MSILIKGVEMPKTGEIISLKIYPDGRAYIGDDDELLINGHIGGRFLLLKQAVPVPTPHGRLIDADALYKRLLKQQDGHEEELAIGDYVFRSIIAAAPTVIESEE